MTKPPSKKDPKHVHASDLRGVAQLATQATLGLARIAEGVHQSVWDSLGIPGGKKPGQTGGLTGLVYKSVHGVTQLVGKGADTLLARLQPLLELSQDAPAGSPQREAVLAALNGVMGDHLLETKSPFATPMTLRYQGEALNCQAPPPMPQATGKVLLLLHGLCMNDLQWHTQQNEKVVDHGATLAAQLGYTPVYLRYNTGLHTSQKRPRTRRLAGTTAHALADADRGNHRVGAQHGRLVDPQCVPLRPAGGFALARSLEKHRVSGNTAPRGTAGPCHLTHARTCATQACTGALPMGSIDRQNLRGVPAAVPAVWWADAPDRLHYRGHADPEDSRSHRGRLGAAAYFPGTWAAAVG